MESREFCEECGKISYSSKAEAMRVPKSGGFLVPYRCPFCAGWHLSRNTSLRTRRAGVRGKAGQKRIRM